MAALTEISAIKVVAWALLWLLIHKIRPAVGAVHLWRQWGRAAPLFPVDLLRIPVFALSMASSVGAFCAQMLGFLSLPFLLLESYGRSHLQAGLLITAWPLATAVVAPLAGRLIGRYPESCVSSRRSMTRPLRRSSWSWSRLQRSVTS